MPINDPDAHAQQLQAQAQPQPQPTEPRHAEKRPVPSPQVVLRRETKWPDQPPRPEVLLATIRKLSKERRIGWLDHADERLVERGFDTFDVFNTLEKGFIVGPIEAGKKEGEWKTKVVDVPEGTTRKMGVVPIVVREQRLLIKTVEWEDR